MWIRTYVRPKTLQRRVRLLLSRNQFRRGVARRDFTMTVEMSSDVPRMKGNQGDGFWLESDTSLDFHTRYS